MKSTMKMTLSGNLVLEGKAGMWHRYCAISLFGDTDLQDLASETLARMVADKIVEARRRLVNDYEEGAQS